MWMHGKPKAVDYGYMINYEHPCFSCRYAYCSYGHPKFEIHNHVHYSIMAVHNSKLWNPSLNLRISIIVNGWSDKWMYGKPKSSDYRYPWLIMNIHDSIVGIHISVMDIRNLIFIFLNYHVSIKFSNTDIFYAYGYPLLTGLFAFTFPCQLLLALFASLCDLINSFVNWESCYLVYLEFRREYFCLNLYTTHCLGLPIRPLYLPVYIKSE